MSSTLPMVPVDGVLRPQQADTRPSALDRWWHGMHGRLTRPWKANRRQLQKVVARVNARYEHYQSADEAQLLEDRLRLRRQFYRDGLTTETLCDCFALVREVADRTLGLRHYDTQVMGAYVMLQGMIAEMETGEGKTLTATLTAATAALAGVPVHVISVNDYLTARDAETMAPLYEALGLSVGCVHQDVPQEARRQQYHRDVIYCTNKDVTFDYLRDRIALGQCSQPLRLYAETLQGQRARQQQLRLPGLHFAIVDEADSVLIDEARTPLIISGTAEHAEAEIELLEQSGKLAASLEKIQHYKIDLRKRRVTLTDKGAEYLAERATALAPVWRGRLRREELVTQALEAEHLYLRDDHYLVRDGKVMIIDEYTGRILPDRSWEYGLHQLVELKEGCEPTPPRETLARMSYQRFFKRYLHLAGMTGTAREVRDELWSVYGLASRVIPTRLPSKRTYRTPVTCTTQTEKLNVILRRIRVLHDQQRAVLVGTASVAASEALSEQINSAGLSHQVLNAKQDADEAGIVACAGEPGRITIATNMAGRGTDIKIQPTVRDSGGLYVLITERHEAARIDRQLAGRCARQGDPGEVEMILSLQDPGLGGERAGRWGRLAVRALGQHWPAAARLAFYALSRAQRRIERLHYNMRCDLLKHDQHQSELLSFTGRQE